MSKGFTDFLTTMIKDKQLKLDRLDENHRAAIKVYEAKREMLLRDQSVFEKELSIVKGEKD